MEKVETIIIGGGISGLSCGRRLHDAGKDFLLLTKDIGGRMLTSKKGNINYGASYVTKDYTRTAPYIGKGIGVTAFDCYFFDEGRLVNFVSWKNLGSLPKMIRLYFVMRDFRRRLNRLRKKSEHEEQWKVINKDPVLKRYIRQSVKDFVKEYNIEHLHHTFFCPLFCSTGFYHSERSNVFFYLDNLMVLFCGGHKADFSQTIPKLTRGWSKQIKKTNVTSVKKLKNGYKVTTSKKVYKAKNVVIAVPYNAAHKFYPVSKPMHNLPIYVLHVKGKRLELYQGKKIVFFRSIFKAHDHDITILWKQADGTDIIFSRVPRPKLIRYYGKYRIIKRIYWKTATVLSCMCWKKQVLDEGLYLASDYNICGMEDAFITGLYAANRIIESSN